MVKICANVVGAQAGVDPGRWRCLRERLELGDSTDGLVERSSERLADLVDGSRSFGELAGGAAEAG